MTAQCQRYIASELTHFVGRTLGPGERYALLAKILRTGWLTAPPHEDGNSSAMSICYFVGFSTNQMYSPSLICFCDIPPEHLAIHMSKYGSCGISFSKKFIMFRGGAPVRYIPVHGSVWKGRNLGLERALEFPWFRESPGRVEPAEQGEYHDTMIQLLQKHLHSAQKELEARDGRSVEWWTVWQVENFLNCHVFCFIKFFDADLPDDHPDNYYFEREWRVLENVQFQPEDVTRIIVPRDFAESARRDFPEFRSRLTIAEDLVATEA